MCICDTCRGLLSQLNGVVCVSPTAGGGGPGRSAVKRGGSERGDNMRRCRSQGTRARLVRALTTAGTTSTSAAAAASQTGLSTTPEDVFISGCSPPRSPGGPRSPPVVAAVGGGASWGAGASSIGSGGGSHAAHTRIEQRTCSLTLSRHLYSSFGSNVTYLCTLAMSDILFSSFKTVLELCSE